MTSWIRLGPMPRGNKRKSVLIVDDNRNMADCLAEMIDIYGLEYRIAFEGTEALEILKSQEFSLIMIDSNMPNLSVSTLLKQIKSQCPDTFIAVISTRDSAETRAIATRDRADFYLPKPIKSSDLREMLSSVF